MNPVSILGFFFFRAALQRTGPSLTFARLCTSRHLGDLQWIVSFVIILCPFLFYSHFLISSSAISAPAVVGIIGAILNWAYQTGSRRLGAIDLFAYEISAICRVCLIVDFARQTADVVLGAAKRSNQPITTPVNEGATETVVSAHDPGLERSLSKFTSAENYTPVYDNNVSDLQQLDANVVTSVTEFYTYRKTMMDFLRRISVEESSSARVDLMAQMLYMQFLMYESGRMAIDALIEYEPNQDESVINILCSEIVAWQALVVHYGSDYRGSRLKSRRDGYVKNVPVVFRRAEGQADKSWARAKVTAAELRQRYDAIFRSPEALIQHIGT